jgi:hypothetical protein
MLKLHADFFVKACFRLERLRRFISQLEGWEALAEECLFGDGGGMQANWVQFSGQSNAEYYR